MSRVSRGRRKVYELLRSPQAGAGFFQDGFVILRKGLPATLVSNLWRESEKAVAVECARYGPPIQRSEPISRTPT